jgi:ATP-binding cassette, subfamily F, member 3
MITLEQLGYFLPQGYLFSNVNLQINHGDKIGLVGKNGAGKSTLLRMLSGTIQPTEGNIHRAKGRTLGYLTQDIKIDTELSVFEYLDKSNERINYIRLRLEEINLELVNRDDYDSESYMNLLDELSELNHEFQIIEGFQWEEKINSTLFGLGFTAEEIERSLNTFSGGWKMRAELARILVNKPDIILLDEPTNHLDIISISWLEQYLQKFDGAVILISHDRLFLDNVTERTLDISLGKIIDYPFSYSKYKVVREEEMDRLESAKKQQDKEIKQTEELINKFRAKSSKAAFAQSLIKKLEKTDRIEIEKDPTSRIKITFPLSVQPGKWVLDMQAVEKTYGDRTIFKNVSITVGRGEKIALLGPNGVGKSTLLKAITNKIDYSGKIELGHNVNLTYFAQNQAEDLSTSKTVFETVDDVAKGEIRKDLRTILGTFLFTGEDVNKKVSVLSGGERTRLALCQLLLSPSNLLILDEPTNHLDIQSKEVLKRALLQYEGTFIVVSHDREFLQGLTNRIWDIEKQELKIHHFEIQEYLQYKSQKSELNVQSQSQRKEHKEKETNSYQENELKKQKEKAIKKIEKEIEVQESILSNLNETIANLDFSSGEDHSNILNEHKLATEKLENLMLEWEELIEA